MPRFEAASYLSKHGWQGDGHTLGHKKSGLSRPILSARKADQGGIGSKRHEALSSQWWLNAFDISLQNLEPSSSAPHATTQIENKNQIQKPLELMRSGGSKWVGLYDKFSKGTIMSGTMKTAEGNEEQRGSLQVPLTETETQTIPSLTDASTKIGTGAKLKGNAKDVGPPPASSQPVDHNTTHTRRKKRKRQTISGSQPYIR